MKNMEIIFSIWNIAAGTPAKGCWSKLPGYIIIACSLTIPGGRLHLEQYENIKYCSDLSKNSGTKSKE